MSETFLVSFLKDQHQRIIDRWADRLRDHPDSKYDKASPPELTTICERGLGASLAMLQGFKDPSLKDFARKLLHKKDEWDLETVDVIRVFWEFRNTVHDVANLGGDAGQPDWKELSDQLDRVVETGIIHVVNALEDE
jgi:hypothetical protein